MMFRAMTFPATAALALWVIASMAGAPAHAGLCGNEQSCIQHVQFDDNSDGVGGCVNQCKLDLEICLGQRPAGEPPDRCEKLEDDCENGCYNSGPDAGQNNN